MTSKLLTMTLVALALSGCSAYDPAAAAGAAAAGKAAAAATQNLDIPNPAAATAAGRATAAMQAEASGGKGTGKPPEAPKAPTAPTAPKPPVSDEGKGSSPNAGPSATSTGSGPQGIAVGEPAPSGGAAILTPCTQQFIKFDANGDGWVDLAEWQAAGKDAASFKAQDADANAKLDRIEFGCEAPPTNPDGTPTGRG